MNSLSFKKDSILCKVDARVKIVAMVIYNLAIFSIKNPYSMMTITFLNVVLIIISRISFKKYFKYTLFFLSAALFSVCINIFIGRGETLFELGLLKIYKSSVNRSMFSFLKITNMVFLNSTLLFTTSLDDFLNKTYSWLTLSSVLKKQLRDSMLTLTIAFKIIPIVLGETRKIILMKKQKNFIFSANITKKIKQTATIIVPIIVCSFKRAYTLGLSMECRCYGYSNRRTDFKNQKLALLDKFSIFLLIFLLVVIIFCNKI